MLTDRKKPRMRLKFGVWSCASGETFKDFCIGYGYTAREAYEDWRQRWDKAHT